MPLSRMVLVFLSPARRKRDLVQPLQAATAYEVDRARKTGRVAQMDLDLGYRSNWRNFDVPVMRPLDQALVM
jgi:hypothetical protein